MQYVRFWIRTCIVFCPLLFFLLVFGVHVSLWKALLSTMIAGISGIVLVAPIWLLSSRLDRSLWSESEYQKRMQRKRERLTQLQDDEESE